MLAQLPPPLPLGRARILLALWCLATLTVSSYPHLQPPGPFAARDKLAHLVEYGILGHLLGRVAWENASARSRRRFLVALAVGFAFGAMDELWQSVVPGRTTSAWDLTADTLGVALGLVTAWRAVVPALLAGAVVRRGAPAGAPQME